MPKQLLENYARLLTLDPRACARLFTRDAQYIARLGDSDLCLTGRSEIERFLSHVPRQLAFRALDVQADGKHYLGEIAVQASGVAARHQKVRYRVQAGRFARFQVLPPAG